jgi:hypothetical protein
LIQETISRRHRARSGISPGARISFLSFFCGRARPDIGREPDEIRWFSKGSLGGRSDDNTSTDDREKQEPVYWFVILDSAVERGDHETAAIAQRELARLGVRVAYGRPREREAARV